MPIESDCLGVDRAAKETLLWDREAPAMLDERAPWLTWKHQWSKLAESHEFWGVSLRDAGWTAFE